MPYFCIRCLPVPILQQFSFVPVPGVVRLFFFFFRFFFFSLTPFPRIPLPRLGNEIALVYKLRGVPAGGLGLTALPH